MPIIFYIGDEFIFMNNIFQILTLDGGGLKGIFSAAILAHLEQDCGTRIVDHFDLIAGTSTGGIIALGLGLGLSPLEIVDFYIANGMKIFPNNSLLGIRHYLRHKYHATELERALRDCFKEKTLADSEKRLVIPSYNTGEDDVYLFKTPHHERLRRDFKVPAWKVGMATSAAPTYLPAFTGVDNVRLVDGGIWANNPIMVAITEAVSMLEVPLTSLRVFSLGTTSAVVGRRAKLDHGGLLAWRNDAIDVSLHAQSIGAYNQAQHLLGTEKVLRVDPNVPDGLFKLDRLSAGELLGKAAHESRCFVPKFLKTFIDHKAEEFIPLYNLKGDNLYE